MPKTSVERLRGEYMEMKFAAHSSVVIALVLARAEVDFPSAEERRGAWSNPGQLERAQGAGHLAAWQHLQHLKGVRRVEATD